MKNNNLLLIAVLSSFLAGLFTIFVLFALNRNNDIKQAKQDGYNAGFKAAMNKRIIIYAADTNVYFVVDKK